ncbi:MAG: recombinase family protein, partial [Acidimicrobiales bacterium]
AGRPWSHTAVLTVLRNPVYVGKVFFRGAIHDGRHERLVDEKLFSRVQALLSERGEDYSKRASATSEFLLAGLIVCTKCRQLFVGTSAVGNRYRYRYYTCFSRQPYGTKYCAAERLPADKLDAAVLDTGVATYERTDLFEKAVNAARRRAKAQHANHSQELTFIDAEEAKAEDAIERYLSAFDAGTLTEAQCGTRLEGLAAKVRGLRERREELLAGASSPARKALLQVFVHEIRVDVRDRVVPWFRVPGGAEPKVRALARLARSSRLGLTWGSVS